MAKDMKVRATLGTLLAAAALYSALAAGAQTAKAVHVSCGDTITTDATLDSDLIDCPNNGIVIGANRITLDLNGHTVDGDGSPFAACPPREFCDVGVLNDGHDGVTVKHGRVREFATGVLVGTTSVGKVRDNRVLNLSSSSNSFAGIGFFSAARSLVRNSSGSGSTSSDGDGMFLNESHHVRILHSSFRDNDQLGIHVENSSHNLIKGNLLSRNRREFGIILEGANRNQVRRNRIHGAGWIGIYVAPGSRNVIARNRVSNVRQGPPGTGAGIQVDGGDHNVIDRNSIGDTAGPGIGVGFGVVVGNVVRRNRIHGAGKDGVDIGEKAERTLVERNLAVHSGDDGFDAKGPTTTLTGNRALDNAALGIEAVGGVIDGGGNIASGNGNPLQCANVFCSSG